MSVLLVAASITALGSVGLLLRRGRRSRIRQELAQRRQALLEQHAPRLAVRADPLDRRAEFERAGIVRVPAFLAPETLSFLRAASEGVPESRVGVVRVRHAPAACGGAAGGAVEPGTLAGSLSRLAAPAAPTLAMSSTTARPSHR